MEPSAPISLRPLTIGEIFDRAIALYVRNFLVFTLMVLTVVVPLGVLQYAISPDQTKLLQQDIQILQRPPTATHGHAPAAVKPPFTSAQLGRIGVVLLLALLLLPIATNMVALGVASLYAGRTPELRQCFGTVIRRWPRLVGVVILEGIAIGTAYAGGVLVLAILFIIGIALVHVAIAAAVREAR